jgi:hypothetical protein
MASLHWQVSAHFGVNVIAVVHALAGVHAAAGISAVVRIPADACTRAVVCVPATFRVPVVAASMLSYLAPPPICNLQVASVLYWKTSDHTFFLCHLIWSIPLASAP